jgi:hypothetical protein
MSGVAVGTYISLNDGDFNFQNFAYGSARPYQGKSYVYASFGYSGSVIDLQGGNLDASLVFAFNELVLNMAVDAAEERWMVDIKTVWLDPTSFREVDDFMEDTFMITGFSHDTSRLSLTLSSPLDAISGDVPRRKLSNFLVGSLPSTGDVALL